MKQIATVTRMLSAETAEVAVARQTACGHDCENCGGCGVQGTKICVRAKTAIALEPGDTVELYSDNRVLGFAALVYLLPVALFLAGYLAFPLPTEGLRYLGGGVGFALGLLLAVFCDRRVRQKNGISYEIIRRIG